MLDNQKAFFLSGKTLGLKFRLAMLDRLEKMVVANEQRIFQAIQNDFHKPWHEFLITEYVIVLEHVRFARKHLRDWMTPQKVKTSLSLLPASSRLYCEPKGNVLIISPWNYPFQLAIAPLVGAIAAGNCVVLKSSEITANTSALMKTLIE